MPLTKEQEDFLNNVYYDRFPGMNRMYQLVKESGLGIKRADMRQFIRDQSVYQVTKVPRGVKETRQILLASKPYDHIMTDLFGPLQPYNRFKYGMVIVDLGSRFKWVFPITNKTEQATTAVITQFIRDHPGIKMLTSDNGSEFVNRSFKGVLRRNSIRFNTTKPHSPQQNGVSEKLVQFYKRGISKSLLSGQPNWPSILPKLSKLINETKSSAFLNYSPRELLDNPELIKQVNSKKRNDNLGEITKVTPLEIGQRVRTAMPNRSSIRVIQFLQ